MDLPSLSVDLRPLLPGLSPILGPDSPIEPPSPTDERPSISYGNENSFSFDDEGSSYFLDVDDEDVSQLCDNFEALYNGTQNLDVGDGSQIIPPNDQILQETANANEGGTVVVLDEVHVGSQPRWKGHSKELHWALHKTDLDFGKFNVSSQARYEIVRTFQGAKDRAQVELAVKGILARGTSGCKLGDVIKSMKELYYQNTGKSVSSQPLEPFFYDSDFSDELDNQAQLGGSFDVVKLERGSGIIMKLKPLNRDGSSSRLTRKYGPRCMIMSRPRRSKSDNTSLYEALIGAGELSFLGRKWEVFYTVKASDKEKEAKMDDSSVVLWTACGGGLEHIPFWKCLQELIPLAKNQRMSLAKYIARVQLALSRTHVVTLSGVKIDYVNDLESDTESCMTDGCGTATYAVLKTIAEALGFDHVPSYFQIRHGGVKGLIVLDKKNTDPEYHKSLCIVYRRSQVKFIAPEDMYANIEVVNWGRPLKPGNVTRQFIPLLIHSGVPKDILHKVAQEAVESDGVWDFLERADEPMAVKRYLQTAALKERRENNGRLKYAGAIPVPTDERIIQMVDAGFTPSNNAGMKQLVERFAQNQIKGWKEKLRFSVPMSTTAKCIPDFSGLLEEGEVFIQSSEGFSINGENVKVLSGEVLVSRSPAYIPSDIQKVRACTRPEVIETYKDVEDCIIFPIVGSDSLASYLSGGDYDGDDVWVCFDPRVVHPFISTKPLKSTVMDEFFEKPATEETVGCLLRQNGMREEATIKEIHGRELPKLLQGSKVGECSSLHETVSYYGGIDHPVTSQLAELTPILIDAPKQGLTLKTDPWNKIVQEADKVAKGQKPYYKRGDMKLSRFRSLHPEPEETANILDYILFEIVINTINTKENNFNTKFPDYFTDHEVSGFFTAELNYWEQKRKLKDASHEGRIQAQQVYEELFRLTDNKISRFSQLIRKWGAMNPGLEAKPPTLRENEKEKDKENKEKILYIYKQILPDVESRNFILEDWARSANEPLGKWNLLRASALFRYLSQSHEKPMLPFIVACTELCYLKATAKGEPFRIVQEFIYLNMYTKREKKPVESHGDAGNRAEEEEEDALGTAAIDIIGDEGGV